VLFANESSACSSLSLPACLLHAYTLSREKQLSHVSWRLFLQSQDVLLHLLVPSIHPSIQAFKRIKTCLCRNYKTNKICPFSLSLDLPKGSSAPVSSLSCLASHLSFSVLSSGGGWCWGTRQKVVRTHLLAALLTFTFIFLLIAIHRRPGTRRFQRTCRPPDHRPSWN